MEQLDSFESLSMGSCCVDFLKLDFLSIRVESKLWATHCGILVSACLTAFTLDKISSISMVDMSLLANPHGNNKLDFSAEILSAAIATTWGCRSTSNPVNQMSFIKDHAVLIRRRFFFSFASILKLRSNKRK